MTIIFMLYFIAVKKIKKNDYRQGGKIMGKVSRELVEKAGIDVNELLELLINNASAELTTFYFFQERDISNNGLPLLSL